MESIKKFTAVLLLIAFTASASTNDFYTVNVYVGGKFKAQWFSPTVPPLNTVVQFNFPQKFAGPAIVDTQVWNSDTPNTLQLWTTEAIFKNGGYVRTTNAPPLVLTNWFDTIPVNTTNTYLQVNRFMIGVTNVITKAGSVVALRAGIANVESNGIGFRLMLYSISGSLITSGYAPLMKSDKYTVKVVPVPARFVQAGTNIIAYQFNVQPSALTSIACKIVGTSAQSGIKYSDGIPNPFPNATNQAVSYYLGEDIQ